MRVSEERTAAPCRTKLEQKIGRIWQDLFAFEPIGLDDNFFDLGGHSLLVMRMRSELQKVLEREVTVIDLFAYPTIRTLAEFLERGQQQVLLEPLEEEAKLQKAYLRHRMETEKETLQ